MQNRMHDQNKKKDISIDHGDEMDGITHSQNNGHAQNGAMHADGNAIASLPANIDLVCFSHLRWGFVYQRPQHLLSRWAKERRVFFIEEPILGEGAPRLQIIHDSVSGVRIVVPIIPHGLDHESTDATLEKLIDTLFEDDAINDYILWYYTPMALGFSEKLNPVATIYDCMDELSAFMGAPAALINREADLFERADLVFTGGVSLYEAKRGKHPSVHAFPSSVDAEHFMTARGEVGEPEDQASIPHPRIGFFGVVDERMDTELLRGVATLRPDWHLVVIGPVVKIDPAMLPQKENIHYLGGKDYNELPTYLASWDIAMMPFARNESTRFISPTKTPEYLAAGKPVVSTSIRDVIRPYGDMGLVRIADSPEEFIAAVEAIMDYELQSEKWLADVDTFLAGMSWNDTWGRMRSLIANVVAARRAATRSSAESLIPRIAGSATTHPSLQGE